MKFWIGFCLGAAAGAAVSANMTDEQRARVSKRSREALAEGRLSRIGATVRSEAGAVSDAATARVNDAVAKAGSAVEGTIAPERGPASASPQGHTPG